MGAWSMGSVVLVMLAGCGFALVGLSLLWCARPRRATVAGHRTTLTRREAKTGSWPPGWSCSKPDRALTVAEAHLTMQMHREHSCARKRAAFETLIAAGRIKPDSSRPY